MMMHGPANVIKGFLKYQLILHRKHAFCVTKYNPFLLFIVRANELFCGQTGVLLMLKMVVCIVTVVVWKS